MVEPEPLSAHNNQNPIVHIYLRGSLQKIREDKSQVKVVIKDISKQIILRNSKQKTYLSLGKTCKLQFSEITCLHLGIEHTAKCFLLIFEVICLCFY